MEKALIVRDVCENDIERLIEIYSYYIENTAIIGAQLGTTEIVK